MTQRALGTVSRLTLFWVEALDGGDPVAKVPHRDRLVRLEAPSWESPRRYSSRRQYDRVTS